MPDSARKADGEERQGRSENLKRRTEQPSSAVAFRKVQIYNQSVRQIYVLFFPALTRRFSVSLLLLTRFLIILFAIAR